MHRRSRRAVKCFTRETHGLRERYAEISRHLRQVRLPFTVDFDYLQQGIRVNGQWFPVLKMQWVEGLMLNQFVAKCADKPATLEALHQVWGRMAQRLRAAEVGHCDLQHGNVLLVRDAGAGSLALKLVDYDGMFVPALAGKQSGEVGHASYQHPQRAREGTFSLEVDRFPALLIATALGALKVGGRALWEKYDNGDNLLFTQDDLEAPSKSPLFYTLLKQDDQRVRAFAEALIGAARKPLDQTPLLEEVMPEPGSAPSRPAIPVAIKASPPPVRGAVPSASSEATGAFDEIASAAVLSADRPERTERYTGGLPVRPWMAAVLALVVILVVVGGLAGVVYLATPQSPDKPPAGPALAHNQRADRPPGEMTRPSEDGPRQAPLEGPGQPAKVQDDDPKPGATTPPPTNELHITALIDGKDELRLWATRALWVHHSHQWPSKVRLNDFDWEPQPTPVLSKVGTMSLLRQRVDFASAKLTIKRARGPVKLETSKDSIGLIFDDTAPSGSDTYEVTVTFSPERAERPAEATKAQGEPLLLGGHTGWVTSVFFNTDGTRLASVGQGERRGAGAVVVTTPGEVKVWDGRTGREIFTLKNTSSVNSACFNYDGTLIASASSFESVKVWDALAGKEIRTLDVQTSFESINRPVCFNPDSTRLAAGCTTLGFVRIWDPLSGKKLVEAKHKFIHSFCFSPDGARLATAGAGGVKDGGLTPGEVKLWDVRTGSETRALKGENAGFNSVCFNPNGTRLAASEEGFYHQVRRVRVPGKVWVWDARTGQEVLSLKGDGPGYSTRVCFSAVGARLLAAAHPLRGGSPRAHPHRHHARGRRRR